jgi:hypothetical protein
MRHADAGASQPHRAVRVRRPMRPPRQSLGSACGGSPAPGRTCKDEARGGIAAESLGRPRTWYGLPFGAGVWAVDYAVLPAAGLYKPIQDYDRETLAKDLTAHLVYGTTAAALRLLSPLTKHPRNG